MVGSCPEDAESQEGASGVTASPRGGSAGHRIHHGGIVPPAALVEFKGDGEEALVDAFHRTDRLDFEQARREALAAADALV